MIKRLKNLRALESLLVREFRISQTLFSSLEDERLAIIQEDVSRLTKLSKQKEELLDKLENIINSKNQVLKELDADFESNTLITHQQYLPRNIISVVDYDTARRLLHLQDGVAVVMSQIRELTLGNQALTVTALNRANKMQVKYLENALARLNNITKPANANKQKEQNSKIAIAETSKQKTTSTFKHNKDLFNIISDLYQQEAIYQVVLELNTRTFQTFN